jgi:hypothetical protein
MNASSVTPNTAGIESSANRRSEPDDPAREAHDRVLLHVGILVAVAEELDRGAQQQQPEHHEHEREGLDQHGAERDEDRSHDQRDQDPEGQDALLVLGGHRERGHDHDEHEQVVDRQALLDDVAGEVLRPEVPARGQPEYDTERERDADVEHRCDRGLAEPDSVRVARP